MKLVNIPARKSEGTHSLGDYHFADVLAPALHKGMMTQTHYFLHALNPTIASVTIDLKGAEEYCRSDYEEAISSLSVGRNTFPYGLSESGWWEYCLAPHSYLPLADGICQIGLNLFNRFLHLDLNQHSAHLVDPEVGNEMLSTTNWFDTEQQELWFASWPLEATVRRIINPRDSVRVTIWRLPLHRKQAEKVWQGSLGDSLHQLCLSPDRRFLVLTELGLRPEEPFSDELPVQATTAWKRKGGVISSQVLVLDLKTGREWRLPMLSAGHVEFDPEDPEVCYLSEHNIALIGVRVGIFGPGAIGKFRLKGTGPIFLGKFTSPYFHRITTHILFRHRGRSLIGVSGYPGTVFLIDAGTMEPYKSIETDSREKVDTERLPHICRQDSYGIAASKDGRSLLVAGTGCIRVADLDEGRFVFDEGICGYDADACFTGHVGNPFPIRTA